LTKIFEKEAVWAIISTMLDDVGPTMLDFAVWPLGSQPGYASENVFSETVIGSDSKSGHHLFSIAFDLQTIRVNMLSNNMKA
jgi:hypothetical protein